MRKAVFIHSDELDQNGYPENCPFSSKRAGITRNIVKSMGLLSKDQTEEQPAVPLARESLEEFHTPLYLDAIKSAEQGDLDSQAFLMGIGTPDCPVFSGMYRYACWASGASLRAAQLIKDSEAHVVFNPSGGYHHAGPEKASGFCYVNDVVLACMSLTKAPMRVLYLDLDAHHGDGVQDAFYERDDVMTISLHQDGETLFPGTGAVNEIGQGRGEGYSVNFPLPIGTYDQAYVRAFAQGVIPLIHAYNPDVLVLELGMDCLSADPLANLDLTNNAYAEVLEMIMTFGKPVLGVGGGGYNVEQTTRGWALLWSILCGENEAHDLTLGLGGIMLESTEWHGGLRDRAKVFPEEQRNQVDLAIAQTIKAVKQKVFPIHKI